MFKPTDKPKRYLAAAAFAAVLITVPCLGALNTSADQARMEWPAPEHFEISSVYGSRYDHSDFHRSRSASRSCQEEWRYLHRPLDGN